MEKGTWITLSFNESVCRIHDLIRNKVVPENILNVPLVTKSLNGNFRLIFVSTKLEYPKMLLSEWILISVDEETWKLENEIQKYRRIKGLFKKNPKKLQQEHKFIEACFEGDYDTITVFLQQFGLNANTTDLNGNTALMQAALKGHLKTCKLLLIHGTTHENSKENNTDTMHVYGSKPNRIWDVNAVNSNGKTALHKAAYNGNSEVIHLLLKNGADPRIIDYIGHVPFDYIDNKDAKHVMNRWNLEWTNQMNVENPDDIIFEHPGTLNMENMSIQMKNKLKNTW
jgi:hypothetical protein